MRAIDLVLFSKKFIMFFKLAQINVPNAIAFAQIFALRIYNKKHQTIHYKIKNYVLLRLHKKYNILFTKNLGPDCRNNTPVFCIIEKMSNLTYCLKLSKHWKINFVSKIIQLEPSRNPNKIYFFDLNPIYPSLFMLTTILIRSKIIKSIKILFSKKSKLKTPNI